MLNTGDSSRYQVCREHCQGDPQLFELNCKLSGAVLNCTDLTSVSLLPKSISDIPLDSLLGESGSRPHPLGISRLDSIQIHASAAQRLNLPGELEIRPPQDFMLLENLGGILYCASKLRAVLRFVIQQNRCDF
jgi:hypothetical protein